MTTLTPRETADALSDDELDRRYGDDPRLNMLVAWGAIRAMFRADPARLLARMDAVEPAWATRPAGPAACGDLAGLRLWLVRGGERQVGEYGLALEHVVAEIDRRLAAPLASEAATEERLEGCRALVDPEHWAWPLTSWDDIICGNVVRDQGDDCGGTDRHAEVIMPMDLAATPRAEGEAAGGELADLAARVEVALRRHGTHSRELPERDAQGRSRTSLNDELGDVPRALLAHRCVPHASEAESEEPHEHEPRGHRWDGQKIVEWRCRVCGEPTDAYGDPAREGGHDLAALAARRERNPNADGSLADAVDRLRDVAPRLRVRSSFVLDLERVLAAVTRERGTAEAATDGGWALPLGDYPTRSELEAPRTRAGWAALLGECIDALPGDTRTDIAVRLAKLRRVLAATPREATRG